MCRLNFNELRFVSRPEALGIDFFGKCDEMNLPGFGAFFTREPRSTAESSTCDFVVVLVESLPKIGSSRVMVCIDTHITLVSR